MEWLNIHTKTLDSEAVIGADPIERGTWLMLLRYCIGQENGGVIIDALNWKDRKCQQLLRVTHKEITTPSSLWEWKGHDLHVTHYPIQKEEEVRTNRINGKRGGRPPHKTHTKPPGLISLNPPESDRLEIAETERNRKGKEKGIGKEGEDAAAAPDTENILLAQVETLVKAYPRAFAYNDTLREAKAALYRESDRNGGDEQLAFETILAGINVIKTQIDRWTPAEKLNFLKKPTIFFASDHWRDDPTEWLPHAEKHRPDRPPGSSIGGRTPGTCKVI